MASYMIIKYYQSKMASHIDINYCQSKMAGITYTYKYCQSKNGILYIDMTTVNIK